MYKIFFYDRAIILVPNAEILDKNKIDWCFPYISEEKLRILINDFQSNSLLSEIFISHPNTDELFNAFKKNFLYIEAAGGLVKNLQNEYLVIRRLGKWDLPKGKVEKDETVENTAHREILEECGINNLQQIRELSPTYHCYTLKNQQILKKTYWFEMLYSGTNTPIPQQEESISDVKWVKTSDIPAVIENTYLSLIDVFAQIPR